MMSLLTLAASVDGMRAPEDESSDTTVRNWGEEVAILMAIYPSLTIASIRDMDVAQYTALVKKIPDILKMRGANAAV